MAKARSGVAATKIVNVRVTPAEWDRMTAAAAFHKVKLSEFVRRTALAGCRSVEERSTPGN